MSTVIVRYFAMLRDLRDAGGEERVAITPEETVDTLYDRLFPPGPAGRLPVGYAVNREYVRAGRRLADGDEVAYIPPVGGG